MVIVTPDPTNLVERRTFEETLLAGSMLQEIGMRMERDGVSQGELACRLGWKQPRVSQLLASGNANASTLAAMAWALGCRFEVELVDAQREGTPT